MDKDDLEIGRNVRFVAPKSLRRIAPVSGVGTTHVASTMTTEELWKTDVRRTQQPVEIQESEFYRKHGRTELEVFQTLVGVYFLAYGGPDLKGKAKQDQPASVMSDIFRPARAAAYRHRNRGLYDRCIAEDMKMRVMYSFSHYLISSLYLLQVLVAATLTAISASNDISNVPVTVLGAINTVIAGILAWLNGQGMPNRYRRARDQYREVVREIEASERMFAEIDFLEWPAGVPRPTPISERDRLEKLYNLAREDQEGNYPNSEKNPGSVSAVERVQVLAAEAKMRGEGSSASNAELEELKTLRDEKIVMKQELEELRGYRELGTERNASTEELEVLRRLKEDKKELAKRYEELTEVLAENADGWDKYLDDTLKSAREEWERDREKKDGKEGRSS